MILFINLPPSFGSSFPFLKETRRFSIRRIFLHSSVTMPAFLSGIPTRMETGLVLSNSREVRENGKVRYMPIYYVMFLDGHGSRETEIIL
ncbi:MAG: hypothetical protein K2L45_01650 [Muribaculaceae bacterium]|nr:hypothetical protein [Muribaculaceae bacterium]